MTWRAFPLRPEIPDEGVELETLFAGMPVDIEEMRSRHANAAAGLGLPLGRLKRIYNSRLAQELRCWAAAQGFGPAYDKAVYAAFFVDGVNIARIDVLCKAAASIGLPPAEARQVLESREYRQAVDADWARSKEKKIVAAPTLLMEDRRLVGAHPYEKLATFIKPQSRLAPDL